MSRDYTNPRLRYPRLEARIQKIEADACWIEIWFREKAGDAPIQVFNGKRNGLVDDAQKWVRECGTSWGAEVTLDDISIA